MQVVWFILDFYSYRYLCLHQRPSSPPHEWKIRNRQDSDPLQAVDRGERGGIKKKHGFKTNVCFSVGSGKGVEGLWLSRNVF